LARNAAQSTPPPSNHYAANDAALQHISAEAVPAAKQRAQRPPLAARLAALLSRLKLRSSCDGDFDLAIAARRRSVEGNKNPVNVAAQDRPLSVSKNDDGDVPARHKHFESRGLGGVK